MDDGFRVAVGRLTERQRTIVELHLTGEPDPAIAARLGVTVRTVQREWEKIRAVFREVFPEPGGA